MARRLKHPAAAMLVRRIFIFLLPAIVLGSGCSYRYGAVFIETEPEGAEVVDMQDSTVLGISPVKVWRREWKESRRFVNIRLHKDGYQDKTTSFWVNLRHDDKESALRDPQRVQIELEEQ